MSEWKEYRLGDIVTISSGFAYKGEHIGHGDNLLLGMGCVSFKEKFLMSGARPYAGDCADRYYVNAGNLVLATRQQSDNLPILGMPAIIPQELSGRKMIVGANLYRVINHSEFSNKYIFWLLKTPAYVNHIASCKTGTTVSMITKANVEDFVFKAPDKEERDIIEGVLGALDEKIDLLNRENATLEALAETLFRHHFIETPDPTWKEMPVSYYGKVICGKTPSKKNTENFGGEVPFIKIPDMHGNTYVFNSEDSLSEKGRISQREKTLPKDSIMVSCIATVGLVSMNAYEAQTNQQINSVVPYDEHYRYFLYCWFKSMYDELNTMASGGTATLNLNTGVFSRIGIPLSDDATMKEFHLQVEPLFAKIKSNQQQIQTLATQRDTLLPRLMSGEVKIFGQ